MRDKKEELWILCFDDAPSVAKSFFKINDITTITSEKDSLLVGMASLVPTNTNNSYQGFYIYGVCTHPKHRGQGIFTSLMHHCEDFAYAHGADFLCLIPSNRALGQVYRRMGYTKEISLPSDSIEDDTLIYSISKGFSRFAEDFDETAPLGECGLLKVLSNKISDDVHFSFQHHMGEC